LHSATLSIVQQLQNYVLWGHESFRQNMGHNHQHENDGMVEKTGNANSSALNILRERYVRGETEQGQVPEDFS